MSKISIVFVPGLWEPPSTFNNVTRILKNEHDIDAVIAKHPSLGKTSPNGPTLRDDVEDVRTLIEQQVYEGRNVIVAAHSAGGFLATAATRNLTLQDRQAEGKSGGIVKFAFICAHLFPEGITPPLPPFIGNSEGRMFCRNPKEVLFTDIDDPEASDWIEKLEDMPCFDDWTKPLPYAGFKDVPSEYLLCENDNALPGKIQEEMIALCGATMTRCNAAHMVHISQPKTVVDFIARVAGSIEV